MLDIKLAIENAAMEMIESGGALESPKQSAAFKLKWFPHRSSGFDDDTRDSLGDYERREPNWIDYYERSVSK